MGSGIGLSMGVGCLGRLIVLVGWMMYEEFFELSAAEMPVK